MSLLVPKSSLEINVYVCYQRFTKFCLWCITGSSHRAKEVYCKGGYCNCISRTSMVRCQLTNIPLLIAESLTMTLCSMKQLCTLLEEGLNECHNRSSPISKQSNQFLKTVKVLRVGLFNIKSILYTILKRITLAHINAPNKEIRMNKRVHAPFGIISLTYYSQFHGID